VIGGNLQGDAALAIGGDSGVEIERVQWDDALLAVDIHRQTGRGEEKSTRFQPFAAFQDEHCRRQRLSVLHCWGARNLDVRDLGSWDLDDLRGSGSSLGFGRRIDYSLQGLRVWPFGPVGISR